MEVIYKGNGNLKSRGTSFEAQVEGVDAVAYEVADVDGRYLLKTFPKVFTEVKKAPTKAPTKKVIGKDKKED